MGKTIYDFKLDEENGAVLGVCAGIAKTYSIDPLPIRIVFGVLAVVGLSGFVLYLVLWALMRGNTPGKRTLDID